MNDAAAMRPVERIGDLCAEFQYLLKREWAFLQPFGQRLSLHALHHQKIDAVLLTDIMEHTNVRVIQTGNDLGFSFESLLADRVGGKMARENLDGHISLKPRIARAIHFTHPACA